MLSIALQLPLAALIFRTGLPPEVWLLMAALAGVLKASLEHALEHREASLEWAMRFGRGIDRADADRFVEMYVNRWTLEFGQDGEAAVQTFLEQAHEAGILKNPGMVDFARPMVAGGAGVDA